MALPNAPAWDTDELCIWFEIAYKAHTILCRIDASCFQTSLGAASVTEGACRVALRAQWPRIHAVALSQAEAGNLESKPSLMRRFVWLTDKSFAQRVNIAPTAA
jgi:hypothetical protein